MTKVTSVRRESKRTIINERRGAKLLNDNYCPLKYVMAVEMHGTPLSEIEHPSDELLLLVEADLHVDMSVENVGYEKRLEGVAARHGIEYAKMTLSGLRKMLKTMGNK